MRYLPLGRTGFNVSEISFGAWAIGGAWGTVDDAVSLEALHSFVESGGNFIDTADVYGDGRSERLIAQLRKSRPGERIIVATKAGRRLPQQTPEGYSRANLSAFIERSLTNLQTDAIDLLQLHCPPTAVYQTGEVFGILDDLVKTGKLRFYGVSVEKIDEALLAIDYPNVQSVQVIFNLFRQRPAEVLLPRCAQKKVGVLARVPLASGLLTGRLTKATIFAPDDHRQFNRSGEQFDAGETLSGLGTHMDAALAAVQELQALVPAGSNLAQFALRWIGMHPGITCSIPGAKRADQVRDNLAAASLAPLSESQMQACRTIYDRHIKPLVHERW